VADSHIATQLSRFGPNRYKALFAVAMFMLGLGGLQLQGSGMKGSTSVAGIIDGPPETLVASGTTLLDVHDGGAVTDGDFGKLTLRQFGGQPKGRELRTERPTQLGDCV
jgi:hypothetical protein